jgi:hypothetical protein
MSIHFESITQSHDNFAQISVYCNYRSPTEIYNIMYQLLIRNFWHATKLMQVKPNLVITHLLF